MMSYIRKAGGFWFGFLLFLMNSIFNVLSAGPVPNHIAFIMDGNRRYAKKRNLPLDEGHQAGFSNLKRLLGYCILLGIKYVTVYAFSIDNFRRTPEEVQDIMDLLLDKIDEILKDGGMVKEFGIRLHFVGNLKLLRDNIRNAMEHAMAVTANNGGAVMCVCVAYSSTDEIVNAIKVSCEDKLEHINGLNSHCDRTFQEDVSIKIVDIEKRMHISVALDPDIILRSSGEARLSNFLLYQPDKCELYYPAALWPELGLWHLVWAVLSYQRTSSYYKKQQKQL